MNSSVNIIPSYEEYPFGFFVPDRAAQLILGVSDFDVPHKVWPLRRKLGKYWLRRSPRVFDITYQGFKLRLHPASNVADEGIVLNGVHGEEDEFSIVRNLVSQYENFIDIGANIGLYSLIAAHVLPVGRPIVSFEPDPKVVGRLKNHLHFNGFHDRVTIVNSAVGETDGELKIYRPPFNMGGISAHKRFDHWIESSATMMTLFSALNKLKINRIGMLKIDIEGFEDRALLPFFKEASRDCWPRYILIEVCHGRLWKSDAVKILLSIGYRQVFEMFAIFILLLIKY